MLLEEAKEIIIALANGINPVTGEELPDSSPYNNPNIIRALFTVINSPKYKTILSTSVLDPKKPKKTVEEKQQENLKNGRLKNAGLPWTKESRDKLSSMFEGGEMVSELSVYFERTQGAITSELIRQGLVEPKITDALL